MFYFSIRSLTANRWGMLEFYAYLSFLFFSTLAVNLYLQDTQAFFLVGLSLSSAVIFQYHYLQTNYHSYFLSESKIRPALFFMFQTLLLQSAAFELKDTSYLYLSLVPVMFGTFFIYTRNFSHVYRPKDVTMVLPALWTSIFLALTEVYKFSFAKASLVELGIFFTWAQLSLYTASSFNRSGMKKARQELLRRKQHVDLDEFEEKRERFFFHDLINHTHGLNLFLNQKISQRSLVSIDELHMLKKEIITLQSLITDHFDYRHKNLNQVLDIVPFDVAKAAVLNLTRNFLPSNRVKTVIVFDGLISDEQEKSQYLKCKVHYPSFYRIMNNLIKNISEARPREVELYFNYSNEGLFIEAKNSIIRIVDDKQDLALTLGNLILDEDKKKETEREAVGLDSIQILCQENGGHFHFEIIENRWVSKVFLPAVSDIQTKIAA